MRLCIGLMPANRGRNEDRRRLRDDVAQRQPVDRHVPAHYGRQPVYSDNSKEMTSLSLSIIDLQEVVVGMFETLVGMVEISY